MLRKSDVESLRFKVYPLKEAAAIDGATAGEVRSPALLGLQISGGQFVLSTLADTVSNIDQVSIASRPDAAP
jgi:hypothetical protein